MATTAENGLFPPFVQTYLPAQTVDTVLKWTQTDPMDPTIGFKVVFNPSMYNVVGDHATIHAVHITVTRQSNYNSILNYDPYTMGIYVQNISLTNYNDYEVIIPYININPKEIAYNEYYKIQVRFCNIAYTGTSKSDLINYLTNESVLGQCSEWSTVCLGRIIAKNQIDLKGNNSVLNIIDGVDPETPTTFNTSSITLTGSYTKLDFENPGVQLDETFYFNDDKVQSIIKGKNDEEQLSNYTVKIYNSDRTELLYDSGTILTNIRNNEINFTIPYYFHGKQQESQNAVIYNMDFSYTTENLYTKSQSYILQVDYYRNTWTEQNVVDEIMGLDSMIGKVNIAFVPKVENVPIPAGVELQVRRSSNLDDFTTWDLLWHKTLTEDVSTEIDYDDFSIESGTLYQYEISCTIDGDVYMVKSDFILSVFDNAFLTGEHTQLCVRFNPIISSFKTNVGDNIVTTIGGQYPYITRNGNMNYRTFSLSGTIAYEMDIEHQFASRSKIYGSQQMMDIYGTYFVNRYINPQNDKVTQRKFRELVLNYLNNETPKLFRSTPEGNILVRITDVNVTPNKETARMICDFSCTATEIGSASIENLKLYDIQDFGDLT